MLISDLKRDCENCDGSGFQAGFEEVGSIQANLSKFCPICKGKGYNLTELGENFWKLYLPMLEDLIQGVIKKEQLINQNIEMTLKNPVSSSK